ncbi:MAG: fatty acid desaturase [Proteobacteria bacterium]|nr:fatty acid desaturase [Pseudomonadota bacterium]
MAAYESNWTPPTGTDKKPGHMWPDWYPSLSPFRVSRNGKAWFQLLNTLAPYVGLWYLMVRSIQGGYPYVLTLALTLPAGAFLVRIFILFHDCVHDSLFTSRNMNTWAGNILGLLVFTSFEDWRFSHLRHHGTCANLDKRGTGDIWTLTLTEYNALSRFEKWQYRLYRSPLVLVVAGAWISFLFVNRFPTRQASRKGRMSVHFTNVMILGVLLLCMKLIGWQAFLLIQLPVIWIAGASGIWLFYVQHQFEGSYWARNSEWTPLRAAMDGSSFFKLPTVLRWFSGNIGYHHIHHLCPKIPNYNLKPCFDAVPALQTKAPLTLVKSLSCYRLKLWDELQQIMIPFPDHAS